MKKEVFAAALLALLIAVSVWNIHRADMLSETVKFRCIEAQNAVESGQTERAEKALEAAISTWTAAESYTHIFIRHSEIDRCTDTLYQLLGAVENSEDDNLSAYFAMLYAQLDSIAGMEKLKAGNIL